MIVRIYVGISMCFKGLPDMKKVTCSKLQFPLDTTVTVPLWREALESHCNP